MLPFYISLFYLFTFIPELCCCKFYGFVIWQHVIGDVLPFCSPLRNFTIFVLNFFFHGGKIISGSVTFTYLSMIRYLVERRCQIPALKLLTSSFTWPCFLLFHDHLAAPYFLFFLFFLLPLYLKSLKFEISCN